MNERRVKWKKLETAAEDNFVPTWIGPDGMVIQETLALKYWLWLGVFMYKTVWPTRGNYGRYELRFPPRPIREYNMLEDAKRAAAALPRPGVIDYDGIDDERPVL